ncbi:MAG: hypothetical protein U1E17_07940 [Geminicoccaceae bacterium]
MLDTLARHHVDLGFKRLTGQQVYRRARDVARPLVKGEQAARRGLK